MERAFTDEFHHRPLESRSYIRLLKLNCSVQSETQPSGIIIHFHLQQAPKFEALSYYWGNKSHSCQLRVAQSQTFRISATVFEAILRLKSASPHEYFWIDQICINQADPQELGQQVALMAEIYSKAETVFVWLGEDEGGLTDQLGRIVETYVPSHPPGHICISKADCAPLITTHVFHPGDSPQVSTSQSKKVSKRKPKVFGPQEMLIVSEILKRRWFRRAWVVQEVAVAQNVKLLIGSKTFSLLDFDYLVSLAALSERETEENPLLGAKLRYSRGFECFHRTIHQREQYHARMPDEGFLTFLCRVAGSCEASDVRDLVYAFLGLYKSDQLLLVEPDYGISAELVFMKAAKALIAQSNSLDLLGAVNGVVQSLASPTKSAVDYNTDGVGDAASFKNRQNPDDPEILHHGALLLPSWVPDWTLKLRSRPFSTRQNSPGFCSSAAFAHRPVADDPIDRLSVRGRKIDCVAGLHVATRSEPVDRGISALQDQIPLDELYSELRNVRAKSAPPLTYERILQVIIADGSSRGESSSSMEASKQRLNNQRISALTQAWGLIMHPLRDEMTAERIQEDVRALQQHCKIAVGRVLIWSKGTHVLGLAPEYTQVGDVVCILHGSRTPVILRESPHTTYRVIGQCYLEGSMYGEAVTWEETAADIFVLI